MQTTTRKGLPEPQIGDLAASTYVVGPSGRTVTTTGIVRDEVRALAQLLDTFVEYNQNEPITGSFDFQTMFLTEKGIGNLFTNGTGAGRVMGDVVMLDPAVDFGILQPNAAAIPGMSVGVVAETIAAGTVGRVAFHGFIQVNCAAGVQRGHYLQTQQNSVLALGVSSPGPGTFATAVTAPNGSNQVIAVLHVGVGASPEAFYTGKTVRVTGATYHVSSTDMYVYCTGVCTVTLTSAVTTSRPITIVALGGEVTVASDAGGVLYGSFNNTSGNLHGIAPGNIMNGFIETGDSISFKSDTIDWRQS